MRAVPRRGSDKIATPTKPAVAERSSWRARVGHTLGGLLTEHWPSALTAVGALLWTGVLLGVQSASVGDAGLVSALPASAFLALLLACVGFTAALMLPRTTARTRLGHLLVVIFMLYGAPHLIADVPTFNVTWRHAGVSTYVTENGSVDPNINAYFNWPSYFFSLPFVAVLVASLVPARTGRLAIVGFAILAVVASTAFLVTRYGNQRIELFTHDEVQLVRRAYEIAPDGALLLAPNPQLPWEFTRLGAVRTRTLDGMFKDQPGPPPDLARAIAQLAGDTPTYALLTRNTQEYETLFGRPRWGTIAQLRRSLATSPLFRRVFRNRDGEIFTLRIPLKGTAP